jgi:NitT/TauT family transport system ATP-binding protein
VAERPPSRPGRPSAPSSRRKALASPGPGRIVLDLPVDLPRPRKPEDADIKALRLDLLDQHPQLLAGLAEGADEDPAD